MIVEDYFRPDSLFQNVMDLYVFDKRLRLIFLDAIERIEVALRVDVALLLGKRSLHAHRDPAEFDPAFVGGPVWLGSKHHKWLEKLDDKFRRSSEEFVKHFKRKYYGEHLPIWIAIELWDFGMLSVLLEGMRTSDQQALADKYAVSRPTLLTSFIRNINNVRNICAHHSRLWNRSPADRVARPRRGEIANFDHIQEGSYSRIYATAAVMQYFLRIINPSTKWPVRLKAHMRTLPNMTGVGLAQAGFPVNWEQFALWN